MDTREMVELIKSVLNDREESLALAADLVDGADANVVGRELRAFSHALSSSFTTPDQLLSFVLVASVLCRDQAEAMMYGQMEQEEAALEYSQQGTHEASAEAVDPDDVFEEILWEWTGEKAQASVA